MTARRPYFYYTIADLERLVEEQRRDRSILAQVMVELANRETDRADRLRARVVAIQNGLELDLEPSSAPLPEPEQPEFQTLQPDGEPAVSPVDTARPGIRTMDEVMAGLQCTLNRSASNREKDQPVTEPNPLPVPGPLSPESKPVTHVPTPTSDVPTPRHEPALSVVASRMRDLIDYVVAVEKDKLKVVTDVADHRGFHRSHDQLAGLPGVTFNRIDGDEVAWLHIERLQRRAPPVPVDGLLGAWIVQSDDPAKEPRLRQQLSAEECGRAGIALDQDVLWLALENFVSAKELESALASHIAGPWASWAKAEAERRKTIAVYGALFAMRDLLSAPDGTPQELVCGIGYAGLQRSGKRLRYPLLTVGLDIELDPVSHAISLIPRAEGKPGVESDPLDVLGLSQVDGWRKYARQVLDGLDDDPLSPFAVQTFESILQQATALLDPDARYDGGEVDSTVSPPAAGPNLVISAAFGFFQRERRATQLMEDLLTFRDLLDAGNTDLVIPAAIAALFTDPSGTPPREDFPTFRGINSISGVTSSDGGGADLYFPKPFNAEQVMIAQRLAVRDGVVVQGPPGTGKTHTIANIISHYLATGRRVLVTSQKSPALRVLQEQLPAAIRPLAVSLLDSDREGLRQFRTSVDLISERLQSLRKPALETEIRSLEHRIDGLHRQLAGIDREVDQIGRTALHPVMLEGISVEPLDAAREVFDAGHAGALLQDKIDQRPEHDPQFTNDDIATLREARRMVGADIAYLGIDLPDPELLADIDGIASVHADLVGAKVIEQQIANGALWPLAQTNAETLAEAAELERRLVTWTRLLADLATDIPAWDSELESLLASNDNPILAALKSLEFDASALADEHAWFLTRPVTLPQGWDQDLRFQAAVADLAAGGAGLGRLTGLFARSTKANLAAVRLRGVAVRAAEDWAIVERFIAAEQQAVGFIQSWNHACAATNLPFLRLSGPAVGREAKQVLDRLNSLVQLHAEGAALSTDLRALIPRWPGEIARNVEVTGTLACLQAHLERARLSAAQSTRKTLLRMVGQTDSAVHGEIRATILSLGNPEVSEEALRGELIGLGQRLTQLHKLQPFFEQIMLRSESIADSGALLWAQRLREEAALGEDLLCPGDWRQRWRLRRLSTWLEVSDQSGRLLGLLLERSRVEHDLSQAYTRTIEQRTWLALKEQASSAVLAALAAYAVAVGRIGKGTGKSANRHRKNARQAADAVKGALPCWIMPHHRVSESLPPELGVFDLVIVDEASQSTLAALPALLRAKQILVVGDDKQVSPDNVGLDMARANQLVARFLGSQVPLFGAVMRQEASLYELASVIFGGDRLMLREHFRCAAPIIEFSKRQFYDNQLRPLRLSNASERLDPVLVDVRVTDGYRKGKTNPPEADYILSELMRMGEDSAFDGRSIGVTTLLGTEQAALIYRRIENELGIPFIEKYRVRVGDPAAFQGDERDVMFLSMVAAPREATALSGLPFEQRFNVAASRARERMILVRSLDLDDLSPRDELRRALLEHFRSPFPADAVESDNARSRCESGFEREMFDALTDLGYGVDTQVKVGWHRIDMVVEGDEDRRLGVECDGDRYHGPEQWPADMERQRTLERAGWRIWRCFASRFVREREAVLAELVSLLDSLDIKPRRGSERSRTYTELCEWTSAPAESDNSNEGGAAEAILGLELP